MDALRKGWFSEVHGLWPGQAMSLEVEEVLHSEQSQFQNILIFQRYFITFYYCTEFAVPLGVHVHTVNVCE